MDLFSSAAERLTDIQQRVAYTGRELLQRSRKWRSLSSKPPSNCDVVVAFGRDATEEQIGWLTDRLRARIPELLFTQTFHKGTQHQALYLSCAFKE